MNCASTFASTVEAIETDFWPKPGPERSYDWSATRKGYEPGWPIGYGRTEQAAIDNLLEQEGSGD